MTISIWTSHLKTPKEKEGFLEYVVGSRTLLDRLDEIIDGFIDELRRKEYNEGYESPSWPYLQADRLGQLKSLVKIKRLVTRDKPTDE